MNSATSLHTEITSRLLDGSGYPTNQTTNESSVELLPFSPPGSSPPPSTPYPPREESSGLPSSLSYPRHASSTTPKVASPLTPKGRESPASTVSQQSGASSSRTSRPGLPSSGRASGLYSSALVPSSPRHSSSSIPAFSSSSSSSRAASPPLPNGHLRPQAQRASSYGTYVMQRRAETESRAFSMGLPRPGISAGQGQRPLSTGTMVLYRLESAPTSPSPSPPSFASFPSGSGSDSNLAPPPPLDSPRSRRISTFTTSGDSVLSMSLDSKYPVSLPGYEDVERGYGVVAYAYDPGEDSDSDSYHDDPISHTRCAIGGRTGPDATNLLHDTTHHQPHHLLSWRGIANVCTLALLMTLLLLMFMAYPVTLATREDAARERIVAMGGVPSGTKVVSTTTTWKGAKETYVPKPDDFFHGPVS